MSRKHHCQARVNLIQHFSDKIARETVRSVQSAARLGDRLRCRAQEWIGQLASKSIPLLGSRTTLVEAHKIRRIGVDVENDCGYCDLARNQFVDSRGFLGCMNFNSPLETIS